MITKSVLEELYVQKKFSVAEIAERLGTTFPRTLYWVHKHRITIRSASERTYVKLNPDGDPFDPKPHLTRSEQALLISSLALYWGEGGRKTPYAAQLGNLDPRMLQVFVRFLREIARVHESRIRLDVRIHEQFSKKSAHRYWSRTLKLQPKQIFVYHHMDPRSRPEKQWSPYGIATLSINNTKFKSWIDQQLEQHIQQFVNPVQFPPGGHSLAKDGVGTYTYATAPSDFS